MIRGDLTTSGGAERLAMGGRMKGYESDGNQQNLASQFALSLILTILLCEANEAREEKRREGKDG